VRRGEPSEAGAGGGIAGEELEGREHQLRRRRSGSGIESSAGPAIDRPEPPAGGLRSLEPRRRARFAILASTFSRSGAACG
jgi:hypothetical protein